MCFLKTVKSVCHQRICRREIMMLRAFDTVSLCNQRNVDNHNCHIAGKKNLRDCSWKKIKKKFVSKWSFYEIFSNIIYSILLLSLLMMSFQKKDFCCVLLRYFICFLLFCFVLYWCFKTVNALLLKLQKIHEINCFSNFNYFVVSVYYWTRSFTHTHTH